jgi:hypothetical protein
MEHVPRLLRYVIMVNVLHKSRPLNLYPKTLHQQSHQIALMEHVPRSVQYVVIVNVLIVQGQHLVNWQSYLFFHLLLRESRVILGRA